MKKILLASLVCGSLWWGCGDDVASNTGDDLTPDMIIQPDWTDTDASQDTDMVDPDGQDLPDALDGDTTDQDTVDDQGDLPDVPPPPRHQAFSITGGGGPMVSEGYMLYIYVGGPAPMGRSTSSSHGIQLGPGAINHQ